MGALSLLEEEASCWAPGSAATGAAQRQQRAALDCGGTAIPDCLHGVIQLGPICSQALDTPIMQRLRRLRQLGTTPQAFPCAEHSRFVHSVGVAHLARCSVEALRAAGQPDIRPFDVELTSFAGLVHDLGHGPFSHSFDTFLHAALGPQHGWRHEDMSCSLVELLVEQAGLEMDSQQLRQVQEMVDTHQHSSSSAVQRPGQQWRLQVVANALNGVDVDRLDYLARDALMTGVTLQQDPRSFIPLLTQHCKVLDGDICFDERQQQALAGLFEARAALHAAVYQHPRSKAAELMIVDALVAADPVMHISSRIHDPEEFLTLDDTIVQQVAAAARAQPDDPHLARAAALLARLERQQLYSLVAEAEMPQQQQQQGQQQGQQRQLTVDDVISSQVQGGLVKLVADDVRLYHFSINYGSGAADPLDSILLYDAASGAIRHKASVGIQRPSSFMSRRVRAYLARHCTDDGQQQAYAAAIEQAFCRALQRHCQQHEPVRLLHSSTQGSSSSQPPDPVAATAQARSCAANALLAEHRQQQQQQRLAHGDGARALDQSAACQGEMASPAAGQGRTDGGSVGMCWSPERPLSRRLFPA